MPIVISRLSANNTLTTYSSGKLDEDKVYKHLFVTGARLHDEQVRRPTHHLQHPLTPCCLSKSCE